MEKFVKQTVFNKKSYDVDKFEIYNYIVNNISCLQELQVVPLKFGRKELIKVIGNFVDKTGYRKALTGVFFDKKENHIVATNGKFLAYYKGNKESFSDKSVIKDLKTGNEIKGQFPNWKKVIPEKFENKIAFSDILKTTGKIKAVRNLINFAINKNKSCYIGFGETGIIFDSIGFLNILKSFIESGNKNVYMEYNGVYDPVRFVGDKGLNVVYMPMRTKTYDVKVEA